MRKNLFSRISGRIRDFLKLDEDIDDGRYETEDCEDYDDYCDDDDYLGDPDEYEDADDRDYPDEEWRNDRDHMIMRTNRHKCPKKIR